MYIIYGYIEKSKYKYRGKSQDSNNLTNKAKNTPILRTKGCFSVSILFLLEINPTRV